MYRIKDNIICLLLFYFLLLLASTQYQGKHTKVYCTLITIKDNVEQKKRTELIKSIDTFIRLQAPKSKVSGAEIVRVCEKYEIDPIFIISQGILESNLGTCGAARKTGSVFNVGHFDNMTSQHVINKGLSFNNPNKSVEPYVILIKDDYLGQRKDIQDLMLNFVNLHGDRYASDSTYENKLRRTYYKIRNSTDILKLYEGMNAEKGM